MKKILFLGGILFCFYIRTTEAVRCYKCGNVDGIVEWDLNPDCVNNLNSDTIQYEDGVACVKATGRSGGRSFVLRHAFIPRHQQVNNTPFPWGQRAMSCDAANLVVTKVGQNKIDVLESCQLCNDRDVCNGASDLTVNLIVLIFVATLFF